MFDINDDPKSIPSQRNLDVMSRDELAGYITTLEAEIVRVEDELKKKEAHANMASSFFKTTDVNS